VHRPRNDGVRIPAGDRVDGASRKHVDVGEEGHRVAVALGHRRADVPGRDRHDAHAAATQLDAQAFEIHDRRGLRRAVGAGPGQAANSRHARDARQPAGTARAHRGHERREGIEHPGHVDVDDSAEHRRVGSLAGQRAGADAGVGDHHVGRRAVDGNEVGGCARQRTAVGHVEGIAMHVRPGQRRGDPRELVRAPRGEPDRRSGEAPVVFARQRLADAARRAGDEDLHAGGRFTSRPDAPARSASPSRAARPGWSRPCWARCSTCR